MVPDEGLEPPTNGLQNAGPAFGFKGLAMQETPYITAFVTSWYFLAYRSMTARLAPNGPRKLDL